ncbi:MAG: hypothetical protein HY738_24145 [Bacteroidia bacterium]|nr:hypothetical protein [Bacteroidia bacterium]
MKQNTLLLLTYILRFLTAFGMTMYLFLRGRKKRFPFSKTLLLSSILFITIPYNIYSQSISHAVFKEYEDSLKYLFNELFEFDGDRYVKADIEKIKYNNLILKTFKDALEIDGSFNYSFDSLNYSGKITSSDGLVHIFTWNVQYENKSFEYFGFIQYYAQKKDKYLLFSLDDKSHEIKDSENQALTAGKWYGALYYSIITKKFKNKTFYTLLGWDGNDALTTKKLIDILCFESDNTPVFGLSIININAQNKKRLIFEYSKNVTMLLRYDDEIDKIVFDHLAPMQPSFYGQYQYYGPDMTHDALEFKNGKWEFISDIILKNPKSKSNTGVIFHPESDKFYKPDNK